MATNWAAAAAELATILEAGTDYEADVNPQNLNLPGYWVTPVSRSFDTLERNEYTATFEVYAVSAMRSTPSAALEQLSDMHDALLATGLGVGTGTAEIAAVQLSNKAPDALPALKITIQVEVE